MSNKIIRMGKYIFTWLLVLSLCSCSNGQPNADMEIAIDKRLYEVYDDAFINRMKAENPFLLKRLNFYLDHSFIIADFVPEKENEYPEVSIEDIDNINILSIEKKQLLKHDFHKKVIYKIAGMDKMLVYFSGKEFNEKLREYLQKKQ